VAVMTTGSPDVYHRYERMGFTLYPLGRHRGPGENGQLTAWETGARVITFKESGYFELKAVVEHDRDYSGESDQLREFGPHLLKVSFGVEDAVAASEQLRQRYPEGIYRPNEYRRVFYSPTRGRQEVRFRLFGISPPRITSPAIWYVGAEQVTREVNWQSDLLEQRNGTVAMAEAIVCVDHAAGTAALVGEALGMDFQEQGPYWSHTFPRGGRFSLLEAETAGEVLPGVAVPQRPWLTAVSFGVRDLEWTAEVLAEGEVPFERVDGRLLVQAEHAAGATCLFEQYQ
jgi:hypothetical protein